MSIGKKIVNLRLSKNLTQEKLAEKLGITRQTLSNWESDITSPDLKQAKKLCSIFCVSLDELVGNDLNVIQEKLINTEKLTIKQTKFIKVLLVTIYFIILLSVIGIGIYFFNKQDFTSYTELDFVCSGTYNNEYTESHISLSYQQDRCKGNDCEKYGKVDAHWNLYINENGDITNMNLGNSFKDALEELNLIKRRVLDVGFVCKKEDYQFSLLQMLQDLF